MIIRNTVPKFRFSLMKIIDGWKIKIFLMPTKEGFPRTNIAIGSSHSFHIAIYCMWKNRIQWAKVPRTSSLVHQSVEDVCSIKRRRKDNVFPEHILDLISRKAICNFVENSHLYFVFFKREGLLLNVKTFIDSSFSEDILLNGSVDHQSVESRRVSRGGSFPLWRRNNLNDNKKWEKSDSRSECCKLTLTIPYRDL